MAFYVYVIQSLTDKSFYKGFTENPMIRLLNHNSGQSKYTSKKIPWKFIYLEELETKRLALIREKALKKYSHAQIVELVLSVKNNIMEILGSSAD